MQTKFPEAVCVDLDYYTIDTGVPIRDFGPWVFQMGSLVIFLDYPLVCPSVGLSLNISETAHLFFLKLCMKLGSIK